MVIFRLTIDSGALSPCGLGFIYHSYVHQTDGLFGLLTVVLNKKCSHKRIMHPLKHTSGYLHFLLEAGFGENREFHTGINIDRNTHFGTFKLLTMNSSNTAGDRPLPSYDDKVDIPVVAEIVEATRTDDPRPNYPTGPPVEVFTTMESNVSG